MPSPAINLTVLSASGVTAGLRWKHPTRPMVGYNVLQPFGFGYPYTNGGADATVWPDARINLMVTTGFDFVRFAVDPEPLLFADSASNSTTTVLDSRIAELMAGIERRRAFGLKVIVDMHFHGDAVSLEAGWQYDDVLDGVAGTKFTRLKFIWTRLAQAIQARVRTTCKPSNVALELFNEPPPPSTVTTANWILHQNALYAAVRAAAPSHTLILAGNNFNAIDGTPAGDADSGLTGLTAVPNDRNIIYSFHPYEPGIFTIQGIDSFIYQYMHGLTFPSTSHAGGQAAAETAFQDAATAEGDHDGITAAAAVNACITQTGWSTSLAKYFNTYGTKALLKTRQELITTWAAAQKVLPKQIGSSEFGVNFAHASDDATDASAAAFIVAQREIATELGFNHICLHEPQGSNYGFQGTSDPWTINTSIRTALLPGSVNYNFTGGSLPGGVTLTRASTGTYFNSSGVLSSAAIDAARFDHKFNGSTWDAIGLLVEPAHTNLAVRSQERNDSAYVASNVSIGVNTTAAPDGTTTAETATGLGGGDPTGIFQPNIGVTGGSVLTWSEYVKLGTVPWMACGTYDGTADVRQYFNLTSPAVGSAQNGTVTSASLTAVGNGWYRWVATRTIDAGATLVRHQTNFATGDLALQLGGTDTLIVWGNQLVVGAQPGSYIPTVASAVTRAADAAAFTIPAGVATLRYTFDDNTTQDVSVSPGAYVIPTNLNRQCIKTIVNV